MKTESFANKNVAPPRVGQLPRKCVTRSLLVARLSAVDRYLDEYREACEDLDSRPSDLISDKFLKCLVDVLDAPCSENVSFANRLRSAVCEYAPDAARIRFELSRVPFFFVYSPFVYHTQPLYGHVVHRFWRAGIKYLYGSDSFPKHVLVDAIDELSDGQVVWGFYPIDLADKVREKRVPVWAEDTSFVPWVFASDLIASRHVVDGDIVLEFASCDSSDVESIVASDIPAKDAVSSDNSITSGGVQSETPDIDRNVASEPSAKESVSCDSFDVEGIVASDGSAKERLYAYICAQSPVQSRDLVALNIVSRSQTYRLLHQLDIEDRIEREDGVCIVKDV